uniref:3-methyladenine DNA glycosylase n=1 Tax=Heterorhabditis bacteriophora TaxID=37862 RepID=A0A1I7XBV2_HETBA
MNDGIAYSFGIKWQLRIGWELKHDPKQFIYLLERVELDLGSECERQDKLSQWLTPEPDIRETINGFGQGLTSPKETERVYIKEFSR